MSEPPIRANAIFAPVETESGAAGLAGERFWPEMSGGLKIWSCKIGEVNRDQLSRGADKPMRQAVAAAYEEITGQEPLFIFSGWGAELDECERAVVENREPREHVWLFQKEVAAAMAMWAIRQSPYACPDNLAEVVAKVAAAWPGDVAGMSEWHSQHAIEQKLEAISAAIPELLAWNVPKSGHDHPFVFSSRYDKPSPDDDLIDLHALWRNAAVTLWAERVPCDNGSGAKREDAGTAAEAEGPQSGLNEDSGIAQTRSSNA